jgi:uncharacterized protein YhfF
MTSPADLPVAEFAFPGPLRDRLVTAILAGDKTSTTGLREEYVREGEAIGPVGRRELVIDSQGRGVAVIETTEVEVKRLGEVDLAFARKARASRRSTTGVRPTSGSSRARR